jgi:drug/metabolite transporter (DMT)-like permease
LGIFLTGWKDLRKSRANTAAIGLCLASSAGFAAGDVILQEWVPRYGGFTFMVIIAGIIAAFSAVWVLVWDRPALRVASEHRKPLFYGSFTLVLQSIGMGAALGFFNDAARVNVVYGSRGLWSILLVWLIGGWFGNRERHSDPEALKWRTFGCLTVTAAIIVATLS